MEITINIRDIPEIKEAFSLRRNKKDSFTRWFNKSYPLLFFKSDDLYLTPIPAVKNGEF